MSLIGQATGGENIFHNQLYRNRSQQGGPSARRCSERERREADLSARLSRWQIAPVGLELPVLESLGDFWHCVGLRCNLLNTERLPKEIERTSGTSLPALVLAQPSEMQIDLSDGEPNRDNAQCA
jgi:hypothetical protein